MSPTKPSVYAPLWDDIQERFGLGSYDESTAEADDLYWKHRMKGIGILKKLMERRGINADQVRLCMDYCTDKKIPVATYSGLLGYYSIALVDRRRRQVEDQERRLSIRLQRAVEEETDPAVRDTLLRASPQARERVLRQWEEAHG